MTHFKGKQFKEDIIMVAVGYYLRYNLSYRDISEILRERGVYVCHTQFINGYKNTVKFFIFFGKRVNVKQEILGEWLKRILK
ncbi:conserved hypothetical protein [Carnobacterium maltaromaticum]|nr:conserved hypothetical protein [Carnobacterium maltaromaticum]